MTSSHDLNIIKGIIEMGTKFDDISIKVFKNSEFKTEMNSSKILVFFKWPFLARCLEECDQIIVSAPLEDQKDSVNHNFESLDVALESESSLLCRICGKVFPCLQKLRKHMSNAHQDVKCVICHKSFRSKASLKNHEEIHKPSSSKLKCDICGKVISQSVNFDRHRLTHFPYKKLDCVSSSLRFKCNKCDKEFAMRRYLSQHMKRCSQTCD